VVWRQVSKLDFKEQSGEIILRPIGGHNEGYFILWNVEL
jgi:hypothetical protein